MKTTETFDLRDFLPYLLNLAAEETSVKFGQIYKDRYDLLRTEWRILFHLGRYGDMTASEIGKFAKIHKTKISRAVGALEKKRFIKRTENHNDRRQETLSLLSQGRTAYLDLQNYAQNYNQELAKQFAPEQWAIMCRGLQKLAKLPDPPER